MSLPPLPDVPRERRVIATLVAVGVLGALVLLALVVGLRGLFAPAGEGARSRAMPSTAGAPGSGGTGSSGSPTASATTSAPDGAALRFVSPSGNIRCAIGTQGARCDIIQRDWEPPAQPASCQQRWAPGVYVDSRGSGLVCDDTSVSGGAPLEYGESVIRGVYRCDSDESGMRCTNTATGRGFAVARAAYRLR